MQGTFGLKGPLDLLGKLRRDLEQLKSNPTSSDLAMNFFVTAEHMKDWLYPGRANQKNRERLEDSSLLLQVCSHIANGAKHFQVEAKHHSSVSGTVKAGGFWGAGFWASRFWSSSFWSQGSLLVHLKGEAARLFGEKVSAIDLAEQLIAFWEARLQAPGAP